MVFIRCYCKWHISCLKEKDPAFAEAGSFSIHTAAQRLKAEEICLERIKANERAKCDCLLCSADAVQLFV